MKTLNNINFNNFSLGDPCCEINFGKTKSLKIARSFCVKVFFKDHLNQAICYLACSKAYTSKINSWETFFNSTKWLKAYKTGYPFFINNVLKPEIVVCSKCQHCSSIKKLLRSSWLRAANFSTMQIIEFPSVNQQRNIFDGIDYSSM